MGCSTSIANISHFKKSACTHQNFCSHRLQTIRGNIGGTHKLSQNISLLSTCGYKKKTGTLAEAVQKLIFEGSCGRVVAPNYVKNIRQTSTDIKKTGAQA